MRAKQSTVAAIVLVIALMVSILPGCHRPAEPVESYVAVVPKVLQAGAREAVSLALFDGEGLTSGRIEVALLKGGDEVLEVSENIRGKGTIDLEIPDLEEGQYEIRVRGEGFEDRAEVRVKNSHLIFLETDKPIYKPGQTMHLRLIALDPDLKPVSQIIVVDVLDAKGIKVFRAETGTDEYGLASLDLPISDEPNLGVWKVTASSHEAETQLDVRVEEYVLPKYEVSSELPREWFLVSEPIVGRVTAEYSFGKPVKGDLVIKASRYVGEWKEYATFSGPIDGEAPFELPAAGYVAGVPAAGGMGNVMLETTVRESATGYEESSSILLTVSESALNIRLIPENSIFKPGLPFHCLVVTETPDGDPVDAKLQVNVSYLDDDLQEIGTEDMEIDTSGGKSLILLDPPDGSIALTLECFELTPLSSIQPARASMVLEAGYSPSGSFIHVEQGSLGIPLVGDDIVFEVTSTREAANFYYEVVSRDRVVFSDFTKSNEISFQTTPLMAPSAKLLVYQILPNSEVAADYLPFKVAGDYPHDVDVSFSQEQAKPGDRITIDIRAEGQSEIGIVAVDKSVYILAENRLNLQQVFEELERLYMQPQAELHEVSIYGGLETRGAKEVFEDAGVVVLSNNRIPEGKEYGRAVDDGWAGGGPKFFANGALQEQDGIPPPVPAPSGPPIDEAGLAEVERVRQYFPETWLWDAILTDPDGNASIDVEVPDSITTWMLRAVALSKEQGLGIGEDQLTAFQPFFLKVDLPYSAIRGEEFPVKIAVYNYLDEGQNVLVEVQEEDWFDLLDASAKTVEIAANDIGGVEFTIRPTTLGINDLKVTARSAAAADAVVKPLIVEPEGVAREIVENLVISSGSARSVSTSIPPFAVADSGRAYIAVTSSYLTQTIEGLDGLLQMPFGCGEQNMMMFAPDAYITKYLEESGQLKPEIMAKAEKLMITGYQRELTYRHSDGSFSAFGESDEQGSLFLTAFVLKCFAEAKDLIYIDDSILDEAQDWIISHQNADGSFDSVGFVCHEEMMGGLKGRNALTAYAAIALQEAGETNASAKAVRYLEGELAGIDDAYTAAIVAYALELAGSGSADIAHELLMELAQEDENGLHWGDLDEIAPQSRFVPNMSTAIEATGYATLALVERGDAFNASRAAKWLVSQRNAYGGFGSTQDTVVALQALTQYSGEGRADVNLTVTIESNGQEREIKVTRDNFDVLQVVEVPVDAEITISAQGKGEAIAQSVVRFNLPEAEEGEDILTIEVAYDTTQVEVNDLVEVSVDLKFAPPIEMEAGMVVLDVSVPTGFAPVTESIAAVVESDENIKRYEIAGRKVIFYIENMLPGDIVSFTFDVRAMYPVKAKAVVSEAYSYYKPEIKGETLGQDMIVTGG